jgi:hypothetical protein
MSQGSRGRHGKGSITVLLVIHFSLSSYPYLNWQKPLVIPIIAYTLSSTKLDKGKIVSAG